MKLELTKDEALVFFEFLARLDEAECLLFEHEAERYVLQGLLAQMEKSLSEPFGSDYLSLVEKARFRISGKQSC